MQHADTVEVFTSIDNSVHHQVGTTLASSNTVISHAELAGIMRRSASDPLVTLARKTLRLDEINAIYGRCAHLSIDEFLPELFRLLGVTVCITPNEIERIPEKGPVVITANHPFGALDGVSLIWAVRQRRPDAKVMGNYLLQRITPLAESLISVDPFDTAGSASENISGIRKTLRHVKDGGALIVFPAGEVSPKLVSGLGPVDRPWDESVIKIIQRTRADVVPAYIAGRNSSLFYALGKIHPRLRTALLPSELLGKRNTEVRITMGHPLDRAVIHAEMQPAELAGFLRSMVYVQSPAISSQKPDVSSLPDNRAPVTGGVDADAIEREIEELRHSCVVSQGEFDVVLMKQDTAPNVLHEIGRLREITFRGVGEGTGTALDIDEFDRHYEHLVLWHRPSRQIVGSYRLGHGGALISRYGIGGMYSSTLFDFDNRAISELTRSLELGRSFVRPEFQRQRLPLHLLWRGIIAYVSAHPELTSIVGCVSISDSYRDVSKELMRRFFTMRADASVYCGHVRARMPFVPDLPGINVSDLLGPLHSNVRLLDRLIARIEPNGIGVPVLLKKYAQQNAQIIEFNVDTAFSNALDGFMVLSLSELSEELRIYAEEHTGLVVADTSV